MPETNRDLIAEMDPEALFADGWDDCILGTSWSPGRPLIVVYDADAIIEILARQIGYTEAEEYFDFNIEGAWVGERTPIFVRRIATLREIAGFPERPPSTPSSGEATQE
jgi:hypothetical protein